MTTPFDHETYVTCSNCGAKFLKQLFERNNHAYEQQEANPS